MNLPTQNEAPIPASIKRMVTKGLIALAASLVLSTFATAQTICIDPGHPSENGVGTHGIHISELHAAWLVALKLNSLLSAAGYKVVMTRGEEQKTVSNRERAEISNQVRADLMIRLHCDAGTKPGLATYYPGKQGKQGRTTGPSDRIISESRALGKKFHPAVIAALRGDMKDRGLHTEADTMIGSKQGALTGSIYSKVPVLLVEMAVLQNEHDDAFIAMDAGQEKIAQALLAGIRAALVAGE